MIKFLFLTIILFLFFCISLHAQWSIIDTEVHSQETPYKYQPFTQAEWNASNYATPQQIEWFNKARYGMFIHFGLSAYVNKDMSWPICYTRKAPDKGNGGYPDSEWVKWPSKFKLENFDASEWVKIAQAAGMKYIVVIAKHHDGFNMWDTKFSDFKITNTPFARDYLKELSDACHKAHMPFGFYYSQRDWHQPDYAPVDTTKGINVQNGLVWTAANGGKPKPGASHKKYLEYERNALKELCTKYGKIDILWFDAAWWGGMFIADMWDAENLTRMIRKLQPGIILNNRAGVPGDFDTPEQQVGSYQVRPWESALTLNGNWAYSPQPTKSRKELLRNILSCAQGNGNTLLSWGAHWDGRFDATQKELLLSMGQWFKKYGYAYYNTKGGPWMPGKWGGATYKGNKIYLYIYEYKDSKILLPAIPGNAILKASYINVAGSVNFTTTNNKWQFNMPAFPDSIATVIELTMQKPVSGVVKDTNHSIFDGPEYGTLISSTDIMPTDCKENKFTVDLIKLQNVTGIGVDKIKNPYTLSVSVNGKDWQDVGTLSPLKNTISLTTYLTGAAVLGRSLRFIQLKTTGLKEILHVDVYAK